MKHDEIITWYVNVKNECARVDYELQLEQKRMGKAWKKWDTQMTKIIMARPLGKEWLPQVDNDGNTTSLRPNIDSIVECILLIMKNPEDYGGLEVSKFIKKNFTWYCSVKKLYNILVNKNV